MTETKEDRSYYVYRHLKGDDPNIVFYVGYGQKPEEYNTPMQEYERAYDRWSRSIVWKRTYNKHGFIVEILREDLTFNESQDVEIEFIALYRRRCDGGTLVNVTTGGGGRAAEHSVESRLKMGCRGEEHPHNKLPEYKVSEAKQLYNAGVRPTLIAEYLGVSVTMIGAMRRGESWWWVEPQIVQKQPKGNQLTADIVEEIKLLMVEGFENRELGEKFKIGKTTIAKIRNGQIWPEIRPDLKLPRRSKGNKCCPEQIYELKKLYLEGVGPTELAKRFGLSRKFVSEVVNNHVWKEIVVNG